MATGHSAIHAICVPGKAPSAVGCTQYEVIHMVADQPNAATPPASLIHKQVTAGARPAVLEVVAADHQDGESESDHRGWPEERSAAAA
jgi:hypothetical protein